MRWAVEYTLATGTIGLMIFTAQDIEEAEQYVTDMGTKYGHTNVYNLSPLTEGAGIDELYWLFPRLAGNVNQSRVSPRGRS